MKAEPMVDDTPDGADLSVRFLFPSIRPPPLLEVDAAIFSASSE
jgi:hypothetical protein